MTETRTKQASKQTNNQNQYHPPKKEKEQRNYKANLQSQMARSVSE